MTNTKKLLLTIALLTAISPIVKAMGEKKEDYTLTDIEIESMEEEKKVVELTEQEEPEPEQEEPEQEKPEPEQEKPEPKQEEPETTEPIKPQPEPQPEPQTEPQLERTVEYGYNFKTLDDLQNHFYEEKKPDLWERYEKETDYYEKNELLYQLVCENLSHPIAGNDKITVYQINSLRGQVIYNRNFSNNLETGDIVDYHGQQAIVTEDFEVIPLNTLEWK